MKFNKLVGLLIPLGLVLAACIGNAARQEALLPAIQKTWLSVREQVIRELGVVSNPSAAGAVVAADTALKAGVPVEVASVDWAVIKATAYDDISRRAGAGKLGPNSAASLRGQVDELMKSIADYTRSPQ